MDIKPGNESFPWKWYLFLAIVFACITSFHFTKPFGFFRESNPALAAITATYWEKNPEVRKQHIPIYSYAFRNDLPPATQFDNTVTTFGYAWFVAPYYFLELTHIAIGPVGLRIFSLLWLLLTVIAIYQLAAALSKQLPYSKSIKFITILLYTLSPAVMWYQVYGYVHETAVLPFYYAGWYFFLRLFQERQTKWLWLTATCLFIAIQFDWLPFFQGIVMSAYLLLSRKEKLPKWMFVIPGLSIALGVGYIIYHYASWSSLKDYFHFMQLKFGTRTVGEEGPSYLAGCPPKLNIVLFYVLGYGILLLWAVVALLKKKLHPFVLLMVITALLHHIVFWGFSSEHDYATLKMAFPIAFTTAILLAGMKKRTVIVSLACITLFAITQYFFLHGYYRRGGMYADEYFFVKAGAFAKTQPGDAVIFIDTENKYFPQLEFYAGRPYRLANSVEDARQQMKQAHIPKGIFIQPGNELVATGLDADPPNSAQDVQESDTTEDE